MNNQDGLNQKMDGGLDELDQQNKEDVASLNKTDYKYQTEISQMMFVFGDVVDPSAAVLNLVEDIVRTQIIEMVIQSKKLASRRSSRNLSPEDLLFLIRYDRAKVNRLRTYLSWKDVRKKAKDSEPGAGGGDADVEVEEVAAENAAKMAPKQVKLPWELSSLYSEHLQPFNSNSEIMEELDEPDEDDIEAHEDSLARLKQADEATKGMTKEEYVHYSECRQASFTFKKAKKFREFINSSNYLEVKPNDDIIDVLGFLAFEIVRELCIGAVELKKEEEEEERGRKFQDETISDQDDDEEQGDDEEGDEEEAGVEAKEFEQEDDDTLRSGGNDLKSNGKAESGLVGNESVETAKAEEVSEPNGKPTSSKSKRKSEFDEGTTMESKKRKRTEDESNGTETSSKQLPDSDAAASKTSSPSANRSPSPTKKNKLNGSFKTRDSKRLKSMRKKPKPSDKGPFCSLFLPPEDSDRPLLAGHVSRAFSRLQKSKAFLQSSSTVMSRGGGLRRTKVFVM